MEKTEKMLSYVKFEHELEADYREKLSEAKRKSDVREIFAEFLFKLLKKIDSNIPSDLSKFVKFDEKEFKFEFVGDLSKIVEELSKSSDLKAIINRMYESASHRYKKIEHDENLDYFRLNNKK
ncbi:MAG: hypothetical protein ACK4R7_05300 [Fervidobacterium sp.]